MVATGVEHSTETSKQGEPRREVAMVFGVLFLALVLRILDTQWHPFGADEGWTYELASGPWDELVAKTAMDTHPPLHYALVKLLFLAFGNDIYWGKLLSVFFSVGTLGLTFLLARQWFGPRAALWALVFAGFAPHQVYWSHVARNHLLLPFFTTAIVYLTERLRARVCRRDLVLFAVAWIVAIQTNYMIFVIGFVWGIAYILVDRTPVRHKSLLALATVPGLILYIPWARVLLSHTRNSPMTIPFFQEYLSPFSLYYHAIFGSMTHLQAPQPPLLLLLGMAVFTAVFVQGARSAGRNLPFWVLIIGLPGVPILIAIVADFTLAERHLLFSLPVFFAYWGLCIDCIGRRLLSRIVPAAAQSGSAG